ncbi:AzlC family ABC transporter permease [Treponema sp.]|uniref:AzlC family ABC transporter permease n=1 Tax=Treponema sp. TaxID=166 RepID=UPI00298DAF08|nr:AzlC family ABC transporter permease [Treponema sp.]MCR5612833.1 AzlC family ABC transporter permease [Treponema sp.]
MNNSNFFKIVKLTLPVFFGYIAIGIPFGLMLVKAGYPWWLAPIMSLTIYAGAGQYLAVGLFASGASLGAVAVAQLLLNIRHIFYGLSLIEKFKNVGKWKPYLVFALTDETYALMTCTPLPKNEDAGSFYGTIALLNHSYWILGSVIGAIAGSLIPFDFKGVDFALTTLFAVLLIEQIKKSHDFVPPVIGLCATVLCIALSRLKVISSENILLLSICVGIICIMLAKKKTAERETHAEHGPIENSANSEASETHGNPAARGLEEMK